MAEHRNAEPTAAEYQRLQRRIAELQQRNAESERAHEKARIRLDFLERTDRVNRVLQGEVDLETALGKTLESVQEIFQSDRAWLLYPCDPTADSWHVPVEVTRPEYPGAHHRGEPVAMTQDVRESFTELLAADGPLTYELNPGEPQWDPEDRFAVRSTLSMVIYPKVGKPWNLGLHQCAFQRKWTGAEKHLFQAIGQRIAESLSHMLLMKRLAESEEHYKNLYETALVGLWRTRIDDGTFIRANQATAELLGYDSVDRLKAECKASDLYPPGMRERYIAQLNEQGHASGLEARYRLPDGTEKDISVSARLYPDKGYMEGSIIDITERKRAERALKAEKEFTEFALNAQNDTFFVFEPATGRAIRWNRAFNRISGYSDDEIRSLKAPESYYSREDLAKAAEAMARVYTEGSATVEISLISKGGSRIPTEYAVSLLEDRDAGYTYMVSIGRDVSERAHAEQERASFEAKLQQARRLEALGTLAGGIAHDFNNLLMGIQGNASLMLLDTGLPAANRDRLGHIESYVERGVDLTRQLLGLARGGKYEIKPTDLNRLVRNCAELFGRTKKEIRIHLDLPQGILSVAVDRGQIDQVLLNLFVNAWQAMPGGGDLSIATRNRRLEDGAVKSHGVRPGAYVETTISDTGTGMAAAVRERIFDPFFTTKTMGRGTGLGLASAYGIVKNHDGFITVDSDLGRGTTFFIYLPVSDRLPEADAAPRGDVLLGSETVLIVDDEQMILDVGKAMLEKLGYRVLVAGGGETALDLIRRQVAEIDLVILDLVMPGITGGEVFDRLRKHCPAMPVLLSSGYAIDGEASRILDRGGNGFIQKPFKIAELSQKVRGIIDAVRANP